MTLASAALLTTGRQQFSTPANYRYRNPQQLQSQHQHQPQHPLPQEVRPSDYRYQQQQQNIQLQVPLEAPMGHLSEPARPSLPPLAYVKARLVPKLSPARMPLPAYLFCLAHCAIPALALAALDSLSPQSPHTIIHPELILDTTVCSHPPPGSPVCSSAALERATHDNILYLCTPHFTRDTLVQASSSNINRVKLVGEALEVWLDSELDASKPLTLMALQTKAMGQLIVCGERGGEGGEGELHALSAKTHI